MNRFFDALVYCLFAFVLLLLVPIGICLLLAFMLADAIEQLLLKPEKKR
jgi:hypothetical protein